MDVFLKKHGHSCWISPTFWDTWIPTSFPSFPSCCSPGLRKDTMLLFFSFRLWSLRGEVGVYPFKGRANRNENKPLVGKSCRKKMLPSREWTYPPDFRHIWVDDFPFPQVEHVSFLEGTTRWVSDYRYKCLLFTPFLMAENIPRYHWGKINLLSWSYKPHKNRW